jgi:DNA-binding MarR family transcriptional regulator
MTPPRATAATDVLAELRRAFGELLGAERRLRSRERVTEGDLTVGQVRALMCLSDKDEATAGELAKFADLNPASMTAMLDHLEGSGVVHRERSDRDRRVVVVSLTEHGRTMVRQQRRAWEKRWRDALRDIPEEDLAAATRVMHHVAGMLDGIGRQAG